MPFSHYEFHTHTYVRVSYKPKGVWFFYKVTTTVNTIELTDLEN